MSAFCEMTESRVSPPASAVTHASRHEVKSKGISAQAVTHGARNGVKSKSSSTTFVDPDGTTNPLVNNFDTQLREEVKLTSKRLPYLLNDIVVKDRWNSVIEEINGQPSMKHELDLNEFEEESIVWTSKRQLRKIRTIDQRNLINGIRQPAHYLKKMVTQCKDHCKNPESTFEANIQGTIKEQTGKFLITAKLSPTSGTPTNGRYYFNARATRTGTKHRLYIVGSATAFDAPPDFKESERSDCSGKIIMDTGRGVYMDLYSGNSDHFNREVYLNIHIDGNQITIFGSHLDYASFSRKCGFDCDLYDEFGKMEIQSPGNKNDSEMEKRLLLIQQLNDFRSNPRGHELENSLETWTCSDAMKDVIRRSLVEAIKALRIQHTMDAMLVQQGQISEAQAERRFQLAVFKIKHDPLIEILKNGPTKKEIQNDYGKLMNILKGELILETQDDDDENQNERLSILQKIVNKISTAGKKIADLASEVFNRIVQAIMDLFSWFSEGLKRFFDSLCCKFVSTLLKTLDPFGIIDSIKAAPPALVAIIAFMSMGFMTLAGLLSGWLFAKYLSFLLKSGQDDWSEEIMPKMQTQSFDPKQGPSILVALVTLFLGGISGADMRVLKERCAALCTLVAATSIVASAAVFMFTLLPTVYREGLIMKYGTKEMKIELQSGKWENKAKALYQVSLIPSVLTSDIFNKALDETLAEGDQVIKIMGQDGRRNILIGLYQKLLTTRANLTQYAEGQSGRTVPFSLHIAGEPGIGKSVIFHPLMTDLFGRRSGSDVYTKPTDHMFTGYINQEIIFWDEFLVAGSTDDKIEDAKSYLQLISTSTFVPDMDSLNNPMVGIKGTRVSPKIVVTANNTAYDVLPGVPKDAIQRRRHVVLGMRWRKDAVRKGNNADMEWYKKNGYSIGDFPWAEFQILPGQHMHDWQSQPAVDYRTALLALKTSYAQYKERVVSMEEIVKSGEETRSPKEIMDRVMGVLEGFKTPGEDSIFSVMPLTAQAPGSKRKKKGKQTCTLEEMTDHKSQAMKMVEELVKTAGPQACTAPVTSVESETEYESPPSRAESVASIDMPNGYYAALHKDRADGHVLEQASHQLSYEREWNEAEQRYETGVEMVSRLLKSLVFESERAIESQISTFLLEASVAEGDPDEARNMRNAASGPIFSWSEIFKNYSLYFALGAGLCLVYKWITGRNDHKIEFETQAAGSSEENKKETRRARARQGPRGFRAQAGGELIKFALNYTTDSGEQIEQFDTYAFPLCERYMLIYEHVFYQADGKRIPAGSELKVTIDGKIYLETYSPENALFLEGGETGVYALQNRQIPLFKNKMKELATNEMIENLGEFQSVLQAGAIQATGMSMKEPLRQYDGCNLSWTITDGICSRMATVKGYCGIPLKALTGPALNKYVGIHVAGSVDRRGNVALATPIVREEIAMLIDTLASKRLETQSPSAPAENSLERTYYPNELEIDELPNLVKLEHVPFVERVFIPNSTKLKPSMIAEDLSFDDVKRPAILSVHDPRSQGQDPLMKNIRSTLETDHVSVDHGEVGVCEDIVFKEYEDGMEWPIGLRELTLEEALGGIPGILASFKLKTSPGIPLVYIRRGKGKTDWVRFEQDGTIIISDFFRELVEKYKKKMESGETPHEVWLGYTKDELVSPEKIENCRTRIIYCGNFILNVVYRMKYGCLLAAMHASNRTTPSAIGINQFSYDMQTVYDYLIEKFEPKFQAGDFKDFDKRHHPVFRNSAYNILKRLMGSFVKPQEWDYFIEHQTNSPGQVGSIRFWTVSNHMSGCFFTGIINNIVNQLYHYYCFRQVHPDLVVGECMRIKVLGDDHILAIRKDVDYPGWKIAEEMEKIGQIYTSDKKGQKIEDYQEFENITFLGSYPKKLKGKYTGALKKESAYRAISWTRDGNVSLAATAQQMVELSSQWGKKFYEEFSGEVKNAFKNLDMTFDCPAWSEISTIVANRTTGTDTSFRTDFCSFQCQAPDERLEIQSAGEHVAGLTTFHNAPGQKFEEERKGSVAHLALSEQQMSLEYGLESMMFREELTWKSTDAAGDVIGSWTAPFGILQKGNKDNIQNMAFDRFIYWEGDVELILQVNGTPFMAGMLVLYWYPLSHLTNLKDTNWTAQPHIQLAPYSNSTTALRVAYQFPLSTLDTFAGVDLADARESLGIFVLGVMSPLTAGSATATPEVTVTVYSAFPNSKVTIPRPTTNTSGTEPERGNRNRGRTPYTEAKARSFLERPAATGSNIETQGQGGSKGNTTTYNIENLGGGSVPIQTGPQTATGNSQNISPSTKVDAQVVPMDNPPLAGGGIPMMPTFPSLAKTMFAEPTNNMALHPQTMARQHQQIGDMSETDISSLCARKSLLTTFNIDVGDVAGTRKLDIPLTSFLGMAIGDQSPVSLFVLNLATFWHADIVFEFLAVRTPYHSTRIKTVVAYGSPNPVATSDQNLYYSSTIAFNSEDDRGVVKVKFNQQTEFLRTYEGPGVHDAVQDYSLGFLSVFVANQLRAPDTVAQTIEVLVFVSLENVRIAVPRALSFIQPDNYMNQLIEVDPTPTSQLETQGPGEQQVGASGAEIEQVMTEDKKALEEMPDEAIGTTASEENIASEAICKIFPGQKFEYTITNLHEMMRRLSTVDPFYTTYTISSNSLSADSVHQWPVMPLFKPACLFAAWGGSIRYRIFNMDEGLQPVLVFPTENKSTIYGVFAPCFANGTQMTAGTNIFKSNGNIGFSHAQEQFFTIGGGSYVDINVPFFTRYNFMLMPTNLASGPIPSEPLKTGMSISEVAVGGDSTKPSTGKFMVYSGAGDDFRSFCFRCPNLLVEPAVGLTSLAASANIAGWHQTV